MANNDATIIVGKLSDEELKKSIDKLVGEIATANQLIRKDFDETLNHVQKTIRSMGDIKINSGGASDAGSSRRTSVLKNEEQTVNNLTTSYDKFAKAQQVAIRTASTEYRNADTLETMKIQLELLRQRLIETRQQYSSFVAMAANATRTGDEGLYKFSTANVHAFETEAKNLIQQIRGVQYAIGQMDNVIAPQGHLIQNWVASIGKVSPELQQLGNQIKNNSLLAQQSSTKTVQSYDDEVAATKRRVQAERQAMQQNAAFYDNLRHQITVAGMHAQDTARKIMQTMHEEANNGSKEPIRGVKELHQAIVEMHRAYFNMDVADRESPYGKALKRDIDKANEALTAVRKYNMEVAGVKFIGKDTIGNNMRSYSELQMVLSQITKEYKMLGKAEREAARGTELLDKLHAFQREIRDVQRAMSRPTSLKKALGLDESTLDHINDKLQALRAYKGGLKITDPKQLEEMRQVDVEINRLQKDYDKLMQKNQQMVASNTALGRSWNYMKNRLAFYFSVGASTAFIKNLIEVRSQYEMNERALGILIGSAERGTQIFQELSQMALVSPYTLIELSSAAKQLVAYDIAAKDAVETTRRLADMASAVGVPMERLTYALGQIKAYGYLNSRDARMFANAGIPLVKELSKYYSELEGKVVSVGDVYDRMKKKAIDFNSVMAVVTKMTDEGGKFFDFQAKMAGTLKVQLANLTLAWNNMLNDIGASEQGILSSTIAGLKELFLHWKDISSAITTVVTAIGLWKVAQLTALAVTGNLTRAMAGQILVGEKLQARMASMAKGMSAASIGISAAGAAFWVILADAIVTYKRNSEEIEKLNKTIVDGAKESSNAITEFINSTEMSYAKLASKTGKLPKPDAQKTWDALREQIETSAASASDIIPQLVKIEDLNERLTTAFNLAERIADANSKLGELYNQLEINQNTLLGGVLGEGLVEDIEDYNEHLKISAETAEYWSKKHTGFWENSIQGIKALYDSVKEDMGSSLDEAQIEISKFAKDAAKLIKDELGEEGLKDSIQVNEAIARIMNGIEQQFPQIKGKGKMLFESIFNDIMANEFNGAVDKQAYYYRVFLERLKKDHRSAFQQVTDDIIDGTNVWSEGQIDAINKTAERIKKDIPEAYQDCITQILNDLNSREFKMRIVAEFATDSLDDINKQFRKRFIKAGTDAADEEVEATQEGLSKIKNLAPWSKEESETRRKNSQKETENLQKYGSLMRKTNESDLDYQERIRKEKQKQLDIKASEEKIIAANKGKEEEGAKAVTKSAQEQLKAANDWLAAANEVEAWGGYDFTTKKESTAATHAQKEAESELQKTLKDELQLIDEVRSAYKRLTDVGTNHIDAINIATGGFDETVHKINSSLAKFGLEKLDLSKFAGITNPRELVELLQNQLNTLLSSGYAKPAEIKDLQVKIKKLGLDVEEFDQKTFTESLNNELSRLKDEYELAVSLDADPELGNTFAEMIGINVDTLPRTVEEYANEYTRLLNKYLGEKKANIELPHLNLTNDDLRSLEEMVKAEKLNEQVYENIKKGVEEVRNLRKKDTDETIKDWNKLIEKYGEYEAKVNKLRNDAAKERATFVSQYGTEAQKGTAVRLLAEIQAEHDPNEKQKLIEQLKSLVDQIAGNDQAKLKIKVAIDNSELQGGAKYAFEEFQKSPEWITATGNLTTMADDAIGKLIDSIEKYKASAKNLDPKQIKQINNALKNLYKQQRQSNPFGAISDLIDEANERMATFEPELEATMSKIVKLEKEIGDNDPTEEQTKRLKTLKDRWKELYEMQQANGKINPKVVVDAINQTISAVSQATQMFGEFADAIGGKGMSEAKEALMEVTSLAEKTGQGAQIGASFGGYGAIIGAVAGLVTGLVSITSKWDSINVRIESSEKTVKRLELAYIGLKNAIDDAYSTTSYGASRAAIAYQTLELQQLQYQLRLEEQRSSKDKDSDRILELQKQIKELENDIKNATDEITSDLLGITKVSDAAEQLASAMIDAFKRGEDYMEEYSDSFEKMIDNMIAKAIASQIIGQRIQQMWDYVKSIADERASNTMYDVTTWKGYEKEMTFERAFRYIQAKIEDSIKDEEKDRQAYWEEELRKAQEAYDKIAQPSPEDIRASSEMWQSWKDADKEAFDAWMEAYGIKYGESAETTNDQLSALQQGIQGITEDTAGALEAYMNGVSQQVYYQSDILTQIRDAVVMMDGDVQLGTQAQMLLQLQQSYAVQMAIQSILEGWSAPNGMAVRVEMN